jgi:hypothetical protein
MSFTAYAQLRLPQVAGSFEEPATLAMLGPLSREASVGMLFNDPDVIKVADHIGDAGPHASTLGGRIMPEGSYAGHLFNGGNIKV